MSKGKNESILLEHNRKKIVEAAIRCFSNKTEIRTSMEAIAAEADVGRNTVYRCFGNRMELLDAVVNTLCWDSAIEIKKVVDGCRSLSEAIIKGSIRSQRLRLKDDVFMSIVNDAKEHRGIEHYLISSNSPIREPMMFAWKDAFQKARSRGELRSDITDEQLADWLRNIQFLLLFRVEMSKKDIEIMISTFVLPSLKEA